MKAYLAGPMSGIPAFNFPAFHAAAADLRAQGWDIISPAEMDLKTNLGVIAENSETGNPAELPESWGGILARDVRVIADDVDGIIFLPDWHQSRGAKLEAYVGLLCDKSFYWYVAGKEPYRVSRHRVLFTIAENTK